jgi:hypothetical protein
MSFGNGGGGGGGVGKEREWCQMVCFEEVIISATLPRDRGGGGGGRTRPRDD